MLKQAGQLFVMLCLLVTPLAAQSTYGSLLGTVMDPTGAAVAGAQITTTEVNTGIQKTAVSDSHGDYQVFNLLPGNYQVAVVATNFERFVRRGVTLGPRAEVRVDASLHVGSSTTSIEVTAAEPVITTETATVSDLQAGREVKDLPLNVRGTSTTPLYAVTLLPGVQVDSSGPTGSNGISIAGSHAAQNEFTVDGFSVSDVLRNGPTPEMFPSTELVSQVKVTSELAPAEYGQVGDVTFTTKGGTNQFHGSLFEYLQNDAVNAIPKFANSIPKLDANTFGGSVGGPVWLPKLYKGTNRTFFFFDWESNRQRSANSVVNDVPTSQMRSGDLSGLCSTYDSSGICTDPKGTQLVNPLTGSPFANNKIPGNQITTVSTNVLNTFYPLPNQPNASPVNTVNDYSKNVAAPVSTNLYDIRVDQNITSKQSMFVRWSAKTLSNQVPLKLGIEEETTLNPKAIVVAHTFTMRSNLINEFRFGFNLQTTDHSYPQFPNGASLISALGLQQLGPFPPGSAFTYFEFDGSSGVTAVPGAREELLHEHKYQVADNLTWVHGRNTFKMGLDIRALFLSDYESFTADDNFGSYYFDGSFSGNDFADFLLGLPSHDTIVNAGPDFDGYAKAYATFFQDSWKLSRNLTIDWGVRYEYHPPFHDDGLQITNFVPQTGAVIVPNAKSLALATPPFLAGINACSLPTPNPTAYGLFPCTVVETAAAAGYPESLRISDKKKIVPRLGITYRLNDKTVVRTGGGMYDETMLGQMFYSLTGVHTSNYQDYPNSITNGVPLIQFPDTRSSTTAGYGLAGNESFGTANEINFRDPYVTQWSLAVERELGAQTGLRFNYTGMHTTGMPVSEDYNQIPAQTTAFNPVQKPYPNWNQVKSRMNAGIANYNALNLVLTHRYNSGVFLQSSYTFSRDLSSAEGDNPSGNPGENGPSVEDRFHVRALYGNVMFNRDQRWLTTASIDLPFGRGKKFGGGMSRAADELLGGWQTNHIILVQTGPFLTPWYNGSNDPSGTNAPHRYGSQHSDRLAASACNGLTISQGQVFDNNCFFYGWPGAIGRFGNAGVGLFTGPGTVVWNGGVAKVFPIAERLRMRFDATFSNLLNHPNLAPPNMVVNSSAFGSISSVQPVEGAGARTGQFSLRLDF